MKFIAIKILFFIMWINAYAQLDSEQKEQDQTETYLTGEFFLQPGFVFSKTDGFHIFPSSVYLSLKQSHYSAHILFGEPKYFFPYVLNLNGNKNYGVTSVFIQAHPPNYGRFRAGLIPISYGLEGGVRDAHLILPLSLFSIFKPHYDLGASYLISYNGFYVESALHNGYAQNRNSSKAWSPYRPPHTMWLSMKMGWKNAYGMDIGLSGMIGEGVLLHQITQEGRNEDFLYIRHFRKFGNIYGRFDFHPLLLKSELHFGDIIFDQQKMQLSSWHLDLEYLITQSLSGLFRWDTLYINDGYGLFNTQQVVTLGMAFQYKATRLLFFHERPFKQTELYQPRWVLAYQLLLGNIQEE